MHFKVTTYDPEKQNHNASFYIQSKGNNAGRPLREPKRNCWVIETNLDFAFEICTMVWISKKYEVHLIGSVIPFLRIHEFKMVIIPYLKASSASDVNYTAGMKSLQDIDNLIINTHQRLKLISALKISTAAELIKRLEVNTL